MKGLKGKEKGTFINSKVDPFKKQREDQREEFLLKRTEELKIEIPEGLNNLTKLSKLEATIDDGIIIQDVMIKVFDVDPKDIALLATDADAKRIVKHV